MNHNDHPVRKTLVFFVAVWTGIFAFMARPHSPSGPVSDWPRLGEAAPSEAGMSPEEAQLVLDAYTRPVTDGDSLGPTTESPIVAVPDSVTTPPPPAPSITPSALTGSERAMGGYDRAAIHSFLHKNLQLVGNDEAFQTLGNFFAALNAPARKPAIHVLHYGDSQIEGDRITGHLRNAWQSVWGGGGPGFLSPVSPIPSLAMRQSWTGEWKRYARFGKHDTTIQHDRFGLMAAFAQPDSAFLDSTRAAASLRFEPHPRGYRRNRLFNQLHVALGKVSEPTTLQLTLNERDTVSIALQPDSLAQNVSYPSLKLLH